MNNYFSYVHFFSFIAQIYLFIYVLQKNYRASLNRACAAFLMSFVIWSAGMVFAHNPSISKKTAILIYSINSIGWISFSSFFLLFTIIFTGLNKKVKIHVYYPILFLVPGFFIYLQWNGHLVIDCINNSYGWGTIWEESNWPYVFYAYYISYMALGIYFLIWFKNSTGNLFKKKQARILIMSIIPAFVLGTVTSVILPRLNIRVIPNMADVFGLIWSYGVVYATVKYKFLNITPAMAADNIIETMMEFLILLDNNGKILTVNKSTLDALEYSKEEIINMSIEILLSDNFDRGMVLERVLRGEVMKNYEAFLRTKEGRDIPVILSSSILREEKEKLVGIVFIARDITEIKDAEEEKNKLIKQLKESIAKVKTLAGLLPICVRCKKITDDKGYWNEVETYVQRHSAAQFTHGFCPECAKNELEKVRQLTKKKDN